VIPTAPRDDAGTVPAEGDAPDRGDQGDRGDEKRSEQAPLAPPPVIGKPTPPPPALTVAISDRFASPVRAARRRQLAAGLLGVAGVVVGAVALAAAVGRLTGLGRAMALAEAFVVGGLLAAGSVLRRRPLELGAGVVARDAKGGVALRTSCMGVFLFVSSLFREAAEGAVYGLGLAPSDPAAELAAWMALALAKPHGPGPGVWVSLEGVNAAGLFRFPEDLKVALSALRSRGWIEADDSRYPPLARIPEGAGDVMADLMT
jgi:hypothetical protein